MTSRNSSASPVHVPETQLLSSPPPSPEGGSGRSSAVDLCSRSPSPAALGRSALGRSALREGFAASAAAAPALRFAVETECDTCRKLFVAYDTSHMCPSCVEKSKNAQVKTEKGKGKEESKEEESTGLSEYEKLRRAAFTSHSRERLPDLDSTVPWSHEITVGRPLSQEEKDRVNVLFGGAATNRTPSEKPKQKRKKDESSDDDKPGSDWPSSRAVGSKASSSSAPTDFSLGDILAMSRSHIGQ